MTDGVDDSIILIANISSNVAMAITLEIAEGIIITACAGRLMFAHHGLVPEWNGTVEWMMDRE